MIKCTIVGCDKVSRGDTLKNHMKTAHGIDVSKKKSRFTCPAKPCAKTFFHATQLINHLSEHKIDVGM